MSTGATFFSDPFIADWNNHTLIANQGKRRNVVRPLDLAWKVKARAEIHASASATRSIVLRREIALTKPKAQIYSLLAIQGLLMVSLGNYWIILFIFAMPIALRHLGHLLTAYIALNRIKQ